MDQQWLDHVHAHHQGHRRLLHFATTTTQRMAVSVAGVFHMTRGRHCAIAAGLLQCVLAGLPASQLSRLQSVLHSAARLIHGVRRYDHVTPLLQHLHWLSVPERMNFKLCVLVFRCLHGLGPDYFSEDFKLVSEIQSRQRLHSASSTDVMVPATRRSSLGNRAFPVAGDRAWNALPPSVTSALSLSSFR